MRVGGGGKIAVKRTKLYDHSNLQCCVKFMAQNKEKPKLRILTLSIKRERLRKKDITNIYEATLMQMLKV